MGFEATLNSILQRLPRQRRTGLFSATQTAEVVQLVRAGLRNPVKVEISVKARQPPQQQQASAQPTGGATGVSKTQVTPSSLSNLYMLVDGEARLSNLVHFLSARLAEGCKCMVYFLTCACVDYYAACLPLLPALSGSPIKPLHGKMAPKTRTKTYEWFAKADSGGAALLCTDVAARGLDIPDIDWIVQFDAPQDPHAFVHRVGRTARMGKSGRAILYLRQAEDAYVHFLSLRKVPLTKVEPEADLPSLRPALTDLLVADRALMEGAAKAFVAYVRAYKEHQCSYIFQSADLELGDLARSLACLRLPKLKELGWRRHKKGGAGGWVDWEPLVQVELDSIPYKDKQREKQRQQNKKIRAAEAAAEAEEAGGDGGKGGDGKGGGVKSAAEAAAERAAERAAAKVADKARRDAREEKEEAEMAREASLMKKLKRGKISKKEFERLMGEADDEAEAEAAEEEVAAPSKRASNGSGSAQLAGRKRSRVNGAKAGEKSPHGGKKKKR